MLFLHVIKIKEREKKKRKMAKRKKKHPGVFSHKDTNLIHKSPHSGPYYFPKTLLPIPSNKGLKFLHTDLRHKHALQIIAKENKRC